MPPSHYLLPNWPAPKAVKACMTLRGDGHSQGGYSSFNLCDDILDSPDAVAKNRRQLLTELGLKREPAWIKQVHGVTVVSADKVLGVPEADAAYTSAIDLPCAVFTADCLPLLLCNRQATQVAAVHAGWRGLALGVIEATLTALNQPGDDWLAWLGPAIGPDRFEVGPEVRELFLQTDPRAEQAFKPSPSGRWLANLYLLARQRLLHSGVNAIYGGEYCTYSDATRFYSYRRDGAVTGRMTSLIWLEKIS